MIQIVEILIGAAPPSRLDKALSRDVPEEASLSRSRLGRLIDAGAVTRAGVVLQDRKARVEEGDVIEIALEEAAETHILPEDIPLDIYFEDADLAVINKPVGMVVHPAPGTPGGTLVNALLHHFGEDLSGVGGVKRPGIVHRIDKDTSGLLVVAKSDRAHHGLAAQFEAHTARRRYLAVCYGAPDAGDPRVVGTKGVSVANGSLKVTSGLGRHRTERQRQAVSFSSGKHAVTWIRMLEPLAGGAAALVRCQLETGRTHQIRVHMAHLGHGLIGDPVYGGKRKLSERSLGQERVNAVKMFPRQALHASVLGFDHPVTGQDLSFEAPLPQDMDDLIAVLRV